MTEVVMGETEQQVQPSVQSAGQLLRQAREQQQLSVHALAASLKVPVHKLQALEEDQWDQLTDSVFTRALALSVCRFLHIDSAAVLAGLPKYEAARLSTNPEGINTPFKEKTLRSSMSSSSQDGAQGRVAKIAAVLLMVAAGGAALYFVPQWQQGEAAGSVAVDKVKVIPAEGVATLSTPVFMPQPSEAPAAAASVAVPEVAAKAAAPAVEPVAPAAHDAVAPVASVAPVAAALPVAAEKPAAAVLPVDAAQLAKVQEAVTPVATTSAEISAAALRLRVTADTWVQIRNDQQKVVMERIFKAGDVYEEAHAGRPLHVVVGNASATQVEVHGAAFDLTALAKNNVARFEVK